jgi:hypothetical protein
MPAAAPGETPPWLAGEVAPAAVDELLVGALDEELWEAWPCQCRSAQAELLTEVIWPFSKGRSEAWSRTSTLYALTAPAPVENGVWKVCPPEMTVMAERDRLGYDDQQPSVGCHCHVYDDSNGAHEKPLPTSAKIFRPPLEAHVGQHVATVSVSEPTEFRLEQAVAYPLGQIPGE